MSIELRSNSKFQKRPDLLEALINETLSQAEIARQLNVSESYVSQFKKKLKSEGLSIPQKKRLIKRNEVFLKEIEEQTKIIGIEDFATIIKSLINETQQLIKYIQEEEFSPTWVKVELLAIQRLESLTKQYIEQYSGLSEVKSSIEIENIKSKLDNIISFIADRSPELLNDFINYLEGDEYKTQQRETEKTV